MKITFLGQAGLYFNIDGVKILIDPYLSDSVSSYQPQNHRRQPIDEKFFSLKPDIIICTHSHGDHLDKTTLCKFINNKSHILILAPTNSWEVLREFGGVNNNYTLFNSGSSVSFKNIIFTAVPTAHSDSFGVGVVISANNKNFYVTGDTLYSEKIFPFVQNIPFEIVFLPINGYGNNMNFEDAKRFISRLNVKKVAPFHIGMFDDISPFDWKVDNKVVLQIYNEIEV